MQAVPLHPDTSVLCSLLAGDQVAEFGSALHTYFLFRYFWWKTLWPWPRGLKVLNHIMVIAWRCCLFNLLPVSPYWDRNATQAAAAGQEARGHSTPLTLRCTLGGRKSDQEFREDWGMNWRITCLFKPLESLVMSYCISIIYMLLDPAELCMFTYFCFFKMKIFNRAKHKVTSHRRTACKIICMCKDKVVNKGLANIFMLPFPCSLC